MTIQKQLSCDHLIIGGGAAGAYAALLLAMQGHTCILLEPNRTIGRKLRITGKGRCNLTNNCDMDTLIAKIPQNGRFLYSAFSRCSPQDVMAQFEALGVPLKTERGERVFPVSDNANDVADALTRALQRHGVKMLRESAVELLLEQDTCLGAVTDKGTHITADNTLLATGGVSYPLTGSTGDGYRFAESAGHSLVSPTPSLIPLETVEQVLSPAAGLTLKNVQLRLYDQKQKCRFRQQGELQIMSYGISGPLTLTASAMLKAPFAVGAYRVEIDLKPALTEQQLDQRLLREIGNAPQEVMGQILRKLLPAALIAPICQLSNVPPHSRCNTLTRQQRTALVHVLKNVPLTIKGTRPIAEAIVTRGGIPVSEVDARTMASKRCSNLYFAGEILDIDGFTGGFNLQIAFATAHCAVAAMMQD